MAIRFIFAPDLPASLRWYADILNLPAEAMRADPPTLQLTDTETLVFSDQARPGSHVLPVASVADARQRFEHRPLVPGENQGRIVAAGPGHLSLIDPANNQLTLLDTTCEGPPA
jgi:catechol 2,3-dioxygenase-like lactoylglutathione lyase family enzyme